MKFTYEKSVILLVLLLSTCFLEVKAQDCRPSGTIRGRKAPPGKCTENDSDCCVEGKLYTTYECSPAVSSSTRAILTINSFQRGGDGVGPSECDNQYHSNDNPIVALSSGWFNHNQRCFHNITISANAETQDLLSRQLA